jgi:protoheme IX farnesyltransferase
MRYRDDYERAGIPMLPVVRGAEVATRQIAGYATATAVASLVLALSDAVGTAYAVAATVLAVGFVGAALRLVRDPSGGRAIRFFTLSNLYLCLLFVALAVDTFVS